MKTGFATTNVLDMRVQPDHHAERVNQLLFGELVEWSSEQNGFAEVRRWDGYRGWADARFLAPLSARRASEYRRRPMGVVTGLQCRIFEVDRKIVAPYVVFFGTHLAIDRIIGTDADLVTPDGGFVRVKASLIRPINGRTDAPIGGKELAAEARKFLGVPYLWGGITSPGLDCSGLVQTVCRRFGLDLPRDTKDQIRIGRPVPRASIRTGDLLFFPGHVAIALGRDQIIHSSRGGGGVRIESLTPDKPAYRSDLDNTFTEARRIA